LTLDLTLSLVEIAAHKYVPENRSMSRFSSFIAASFAVGVALSSAAPVMAADYVEGPAQSYDETCGQAGVLNRIVNKFSYQVRHVPNLPQVAIDNFSDVQQTRHEPSADPEMDAVERHYCRATAHLSDGSQQPVWYLVEHGQGFVGVGNNVEFCLAGFDRWHVYSGSCRTLR
jgi:capsid protein